MNCITQIIDGKVYTFQLTLTLISVVDVVPALEFAPVNMQTCNQCKKNLSFDYFKRKCDSCVECNEKRRQGVKCKHGTRKSRCRDCGGGSICKHGARKSRCRDCDPVGHLVEKVQKQIYRALKRKTSRAVIQYLECSINEFKQHIESQFKEGMTWKNHGGWHIDHIIPLKYGDPTIKQVAERLHWTNTQPLWATDNISKGNRFIG